MHVHLTVSVIPDPPPLYPMMTFFPLSYLNAHAGSTASVIASVESDAKQL